MPPRPARPFSVSFGERVRNERTRNELTQEALADLCGMHFTYLGRIERGEQNVTLETILKISAALGVDPADLVRGLDGRSLIPKRRRRR